jgi:membrane protease YdiL (CAAX protease family)
MSSTRRVVIFVIIAYAFSWLFWVPEALIAQNLWNAPPTIRDFLAGSLNPGAYGPLFAAVVTAALFGGRAGVISLLKRGLQIRLGEWWWWALLTFPVLIGGSLGLAILLGSPVPAFEAFAQPVALPIILIWIFFLGGPIQEEFGWRGYAFEHLRHTTTSLNAAIVAALMWGFWHLPLFFIPRQDIYYNRPFWGLILTTLLVGIILAWMYANTGGSVFAVIVGHTMFNWSNVVFPTLNNDTAALLLFVLYALLVAFIIWRYGAQTLKGDQPAVSQATSE